MLVHHCFTITWRESLIATRLQFIFTLVQENLGISLDFDRILWHAEVVEIESMALVNSLSLDGRGTCAHPVRHIGCIGSRYLLFAREFSTARLYANVAMFQVLVGCPTLKDFESEVAPGCFAVLQTTWSWCFLVQWRENLASPFHPCLCPSLHMQPSRVSRQRCCHRDKTRNTIATPAHLICQCSDWTDACGIVD